MDDSTAEVMGAARTPDFGATPRVHMITERPQFEVLLIDTRVAILTGNMYAELERSGQPIERADPTFAATASSPASV